MRDGRSNSEGSVQYNSEAMRSLAAHQSLLTLVHEGAPDARALARLAVPMTEYDFLSMCEERSLACKCGNPLCKTEHQHKASDDSARIDWKSLAILKLAVDQHWCSKECHIKCAQFSKSLGNAIDRLEVLRKLNAGPGLASRHGSNNEDDDRDAMMKGILGSVREHSVPRTATVIPPRAVEPASTVNAGRAPCAHMDPVVERADATDPPHAAGSSDGGASSIANVLVAAAAEDTLKQVLADPCRRQVMIDADLAQGCVSGSRTGPKKPAPFRRRSRASELLKDIHQSLKNPVVPAEVEDFDLIDSDDDVGGTCPTQGVPGAPTEVLETAKDALKPEVPDSVAVRLAGSHARSAQVNELQQSVNTGAKMETDSVGDIGTVAQPSAGPSSRSPASAVCCGETSVSRHPASYTNLKGKFKPRVAKLPSNPKHQFQDTVPGGHYERSQGAGCKGDAPPSRSSVAPSTAPTSQGSSGSDVRTEARPGRKRVTFSSCQMLEYDPELPPAESADEDCMCEVPLLPAASATPLQGFHNSVISTQQVSNVGPAWNGLGHRADLPCSSDVNTCRWLRCGAVEGVSGLIDRAVANCPISAECEAAHDGLLPTSTTATAPNCDIASAQDASKALGRAGATAAAPESAHDGEVTPVLYFDVHANRSEGSMEGALRVTTAEALQLSEQDLAELHTQAGAGRSSSAGCVLDVQGGDAVSSDEDSAVDPEEPVSEEDSLDVMHREQPESIRRPRIRKRRQTEAAIEVSQEALSAEQQHELNRQAVADAFRYYLAPEAGGVGVAATGCALHELASDLSQRTSSHRQHGTSSAQQAEGSPHVARATDSSPSCAPGAAEEKGADGLIRADDVAHSDAAEQASHKTRPHTVGLADEQQSEAQTESSADSWTTESADGGDEDALEAHCASSQHGEACEEVMDGNGKAVDGYFDSAASATPGLSVFGIAWRLLGVWACQASVLHLHQPDLHPAHCFFERTRQGQRALTNVLLKRVAPMLESLGMAPKVPVAPVEAELHGLLATLDVRDAVPTMALPLQNSLVLVLLAAVSCHRMPQMADALQTSSPRMARALKQSQLTPELFSCLVDCLVDSA